MAELTGTGSIVDEAARGFQTLHMMEAGANFGSVPSGRAQNAQQIFAFLSQSWGSDLNDAERFSYTVLGQAYPLGKKSTSAGKNVWMSLNFSRLQAGMDVLRVAPQKPQMSFPVPDYSVTAVNNGTTFVLRVVPAQNFSASKTLVSATKPLSSGTTRMETQQYVPLEVSDNLITAGVSIAQSYRDAIGYVPDAGMRVGVCLTPITPLGFTGVPKYRDVLVQAL